MSNTKKTGVLSWLGTTVKTIIDKASDEIVTSHVAWMESEITRLKQSFDFSTAAAQRKLDSSERKTVAVALYRRFIARCWKDSQLTARESELLSWLASNVGLSKSVAAAMNQQAAGEIFKTTLAQAFADGQIDDSERQHLDAVAAAAGQTVAALMTLLFKQEGEQLLRSLFTGMASDGQLNRDEWKQFRQTAEWLGASREAMLPAIRNPAKQLVEHALVDARSDKEITEREEKLINSLLDNIIDDAEFAAYVRGEIAEASAMQALARGLLPSVACPAGIALRSGEITHWAGTVVFTNVRERASGARIDTSVGTLVITDARAIFTAADKAFDMNHRKVLAHLPFGRMIEIRCSGKGAGGYDFGDAGVRPVAIWETAIGRANQTIVASDDKEARRRIPRDVRQRVWQKYGGRCAECNAETYLEFDHIIPVAKGGGNSDTNVQLLCRKCNLTKSDNI